MNVQKVIMTPEWAKELLQKNNQNRMPKVALIVKLRGDIRRGKWHLTHQPIAVDKNGCLIDGQHRLIAISLEGISVPLMLATDCDNDSMIAVDTGNSRTVGDVLKISGMKNASLKASIAKLYLSFYDYPNLMWNGRNAYSVQCLNDKISELSCIDESVLMAKRYYYQFKQLNVSAISCFILLAIDHNYTFQEIDNFFHQLSSGEGVLIGEPIYAYRQFLININKSRYYNRKATQILLADFIKIFNLYLKNAEVRKYHPPTIPPMPSFLLRN
jgi:hypothetical protein